MDAELTLRLSVALYYLMLFIIMRHFRRGALRAGSRRAATTQSNRAEGLGKRYTRKVAGWILFSGALLFIIWPDAIAFAAIPLPTELRLGAVLIAFLSLPALVWVLRVLGKQWTRQLIIQQGHQLVTWGPYRHVRHPMYTLIFLTLICLSLSTASWLLLIPSLLVIAVITRRIPREEAQLVAAFPDDYQAYRARTGSLLPRIRSRIR